MSVLKFRVNNLWVDFCSLTKVSFFKSGTFHQFKSGDRVYRGGSWVPVTCSTEPSIATVVVSSVGADPQIGSTNRYKFVITTSIALQEDVFVQFYALYESPTGEELTIVSELTLPAGQVSAETSYEITNASPASDLPAITINSSTPINGATVHKYSDSSPLILSLSA